MPRDTPRRMAGIQDAAQDDGVGAVAAQRGCMTSEESFADHYFSSGENGRVLGVKTVANKCLENRVDGIARRQIYVINL